MIRQSADHVLVGLFLPYFLLTVLSLIVVWTFAYLIKRKVIEFAMEAVRDGRLDSKDAPKFVAELHGALKHGTVPGRGRRAA